MIMRQGKKTRSAVKEQLHHRNLSQANGNIWCIKQGSRSAVQVNDRQARVTNRQSWPITTKRLT